MGPLEVNDIAAHGFCFETERKDTKGAAGNSLDDITHEDGFKTSYSSNKMRMIMTAREAFLTLFGLWN